MKTLFAACTFLVGTLVSSGTATADDADWQAVLEAGKGQQVYFHAWGGEPRINAYIQWAASKVKNQYGIDVVHVKVTETAAVVSQILAEKTAGKETNGAVDLVWINGENFAAMKTSGLLANAGWAQELPNWKHVDVDNKPTVLIDFTVPTDGQESPWGMAKLVFMHDSARLPAPPKDLNGLLEFAKDNPGRFSYPQPPNFFGTTFLKQVLADTVADPSVLDAPVEAENFETVTTPLFTYLDQLHPHLWRKGNAFPKNAAHMRQLLADAELDIAFSFNPGDASAAILSGELPETVRSFVFDGGTLGNTHFVAIPFNSSSKEGAKIFADFLLSPLAQFRKQDPKIWGDPTVLNVKALPQDQQTQFDGLDLGPATLSPAELGKTLPEPHPSWVAALEKAWAARYGTGGQ